MNTSDKAEAVLEAYLGMERKGRGWHDPAKLQGRIAFLMKATSLMEEAGTGTVAPSVMSMASAIGLSMRSTSRHMEGLVSEGVLTKEDDRPRPCKLGFTEEFRNLAGLG